ADGLAYVGLGRLVLGALAVVEVDRDRDRDQHTDDDDDDQKFDHGEAAVVLRALLPHLAECFLHGEPPATRVGGTAVVAVARRKLGQLVRCIHWAPWMCW